MLTAFSNRCHVNAMKTEPIWRCVFPRHPAVVYFVGLAMLLGACERASQPAAPNAETPTSSASAGERIQFRQGGNSERYRVSGWSHTEADFTWTEGTSAKLEVPVPSSGPWTLIVSMSGLIRPPDRVAQAVEVYANDQKIAEWQVGSVSEFRATIPASASKAGGTMAIEFRTPGATSPQALGMNSDSRVLGVCVRWLELAKNG
jgi:hypothetical protein